MDMIQIDPKLFVTCRLCLEDLGQYQIVPIVQQQIKYCYDIDVEPFDGLPQLICSKCKEVMTNFHTTKKLLCEKQNNLRNKVSNDINDICIQPQQDPVSSSQQPSEHLEERKSAQSKRILDSSESDENSTKVNKSQKKKTRVTWNYKGFKKTVICTICNSEWPNVRLFDRHKREHNYLHKKYAPIFDNNCSVMLEKVDRKPNITGMDNIVVHNNKQMIEHRNRFYYVRYSKEKDSENDESTSEGSVSKKSYHKNINPDSSDSEQDIVAKPIRRKRRVLSQSSGDTVVIETNNKCLSDNDEESKGTQDSNYAQSASAITDECINIDSSDSDADTYQVESSIRGKQPFEATHGDYKVIQGIISTCVNAYYRKNETGKSEKQGNIESQLKHKLLSIGRKIVNRQGFNWTGLLRYMEHKNLGIMWATKAITTTNGKDTNYIRIMTKLRGNKTETTNDACAWVPVTTAEEPAPEPIPIEASAPEARPIVAPPFEPIEPSSPSVIVSNASLRVTSGTTTAVSANKTLISSPLATLIPQDFNISQAPPDTAILLYCATPDPKSKLLNANPVANPKQLPRKVGQTSEIRLARTAQVSSPSEEIDPDLCMPIITSTTSLASQPEAINDTPPAPTPSTEKAIPRIKVKPVSELMSERTLNSLRQEQAASSTSTTVNQIDTTNSLLINPTVWSPQSVANMYITNVSPQMSIANQPIQLVQLSCLNMTPSQNAVAAYQIANPVPATSNNNTNNNEELVLLNTVELPNTKTTSPFNYLKTLLLLHNLKLFDPCETVLTDYVCLLKFRVQFKQEPITEPLFLCLSFLYLNNQFCFMIKDRNHRNININKISPNWQWEILNVFDRGDLVTRLLQNAQKHSPETFDNTNKFLCLLKSIDFQKL